MSNANPQQQQYPNSVGLTASKMKASLAFYRDKLGFELKECWPDKDNALWANLVLDGQSVMFGQAAPPSEMEKMCGGDPAAGKFWAKKAEAFQKSEKGVGVNLYLMVPDIDAYAAKVQRNGVKLDLPPTSQFYGLRNVVITDPDGYVLTFYTPIKMESCQSCGMPLADATPGQMYCGYCTDEKGTLRPYEQVYEGTVKGFFMEHMKLPRPAAEKAAKEHLAKMPAWASRG
jgi:catechol 2,3-dioxygenase-like lactoylglutathione lyase family enzyme